MTPAQILAMSALGMAPAVLAPMLRMQGITRPPFNLIISNVPGPKNTHYFRGAQARGRLPVVDPDQRDGAQHHLHVVRRADGLRPHRLPPHRPTAAAAAPPPRQRAHRPGEGRRRLTLPSDIGCLGVTSRSLPAVRQRCRKVTSRSLLAVRCRRVRCGVAAQPARKSRKRDRGAAGARLLGHDHPDAAFTGRAARFGRERGMPRVAPGAVRRDGLGVRAVALGASDPPSGCSRWVKRRPRATS